MTDISQSGQAAKPMTKLDEWKNGWPIVVASLVGIALCLSPLPYWALIVIGDELASEFGWSRPIITGGFLFMTAGVLIGAPLAGQLVDRYGARRVLLPSIMALSVGTSCFALMTSNPAVFYFIFFVTAFLGSATLPITWSKAIVNNFDKHRGLALGIALTGTGLYGFIATPSIQAMINAFGWRWAYVGVGVLPVLFSLPLAAFLFRDHKEEKALSETDNKGAATLISWIWKPILIAIIVCTSFIYFISKPNGVYLVLGLMVIILFGYLAYTYNRAKTEPVVSGLHGLTVQQTFADYRFWIMIFAFIILGAVVSGIIANSKFILIDKGYSVDQATNIFIGAGIIALATLAGRLIGGFLVDYFWAPLIAFIFMSIPALGCFILMNDMSIGMNVLALITIGLAAGVEFDLMAYFVSRYFGMRSYGRIYGLIYAAFGLGSGCSPVIFNLIRGDSPDYSGVLAIAAFGFLIGGAILLTLGKYRDFGDVGGHGH